MMKTRAPLALLLVLLIEGGQAWVSERRVRVESLMLKAHQEDEDALRRRMEVVRSLQTSFYKSEAPKQSLDLSDGILYNLPLWRVPWNEIPGRSNCLYVHEPIYTNMFETILQGTEAPFYFGHLYLPGGSKNLKSEKGAYRLKTWDQQVGEETSQFKAAAIGTLLRISDFRRISDGRLLLLVQALERFVVKEVQQELPYGVAHVQLIPDVEEVEESDWLETRTEGDVQTARGLALSETWQRWHRYEFENTMLPLPLRTEIPASDIVGSALAKVLPYAPFSQVVNVDALSREDLPRLSADGTGRVVAARKTTDYSQNTFEYRLIQGNILSRPAVRTSLLSKTIDELEIDLWLALDNFLKTSRKPVSPILLGLLPPDVKWPSEFTLNKIGRAITEQSSLDHKYVAVSPQYPALRRQKRFSYCVGALLEDLDTVNEFRYQLLQLSSTKERLAFVLQTMEEWGSFG